MRRYSEAKTRVANSIDEIPYVSTLHDLEAVIYKAILQKGLGMLPYWTQKDMGAIIQIHKDLLKPMRVHSPDALAKLMEQARLIKASLDVYLPDPDGLTICRQILSMIAVNYDMVKKNGAASNIGYLMGAQAIRDFLRIDPTVRNAITGIKVPEWIDFVNRHLVNFSDLSAGTLRELMKFFEYTAHGNPLVANAARRAFRGLDVVWDGFMQYDDMDRQRGLQVLLVALDQMGPPAAARAPNIHGAQIQSAVASTAIALIEAYKQAGMLPTKTVTTVDSITQAVIVPIPENILNSAIKKFKAALKKNIMKDAAKITLFQKGAAAEVYVKLPSYDVAINIHQKAYAQVRPLAKEVQNLTGQIESAHAARTTIDPKLERVLIEKRAQLNTLNEFTRAYGALMYLESKHFESEPKNIIGTTLPKMTIKQLFGMSLLLPECINQNWHEGLDALAQRQEAVYERLTEALHDSHIAYLGTVHDQSNSCWDGGANRFMLAVRTLINVELLPAPADFMSEFRQSLIEMLISFATPAFLNDNRDASRAIRNQLSDLIKGHDGTVSQSLYNVIKHDHIKKLITVYPQMRLASNRLAAKALLRDAMMSLEYIDLPVQFREVYGSEASPADEAGHDQKLPPKQSRTA